MYSYACTHELESVCNDSLDTLQHPRKRIRTVKVDLGQSEAPLLSTTVQLSPQSFTAATQEVLGSISTAAFAIPCIVRYVSLFEAIHAEHKRLHSFHMNTTIT